MTKQFILKSIGVISVVLCSFAAGVVMVSTVGKDKITIDMANTIYPLMKVVANNACYPEGPDYQNKGENAAIIYRSEPLRMCTSGYGNITYARCYIAEWDGLKLYYTPKKDVKIGFAHSCLAEEDVDMPYFDKRLSEAKIGKRYLVVSHE